MHRDSQNICWDLLICRTWYCSIASRIYRSSREAPPGNPNFRILSASDWRMQFQPKIVNKRLVKPRDSNFYTWRSPRKPAQTRATTSGLCWRAMSPIAAYLFSCTRRLSTIKTFLSSFIINHRLSSHCSFLSFKSLMMFSTNDPLGNVSSPEWPLFGSRILVNAFSHRTDGLLNKSVSQAHRRC